MLEHAPSLLKILQGNGCIKMQFPVSEMIRDRKLDYDLSSSRTLGI
jgi:hypothetical protein